MRFIWKYMSKYKSVIAFGMGLKLLGTIMELLIPYIMEHLLDDVAPTKNLTAVLFWGILMLITVYFCRYFNVKANRNAVRVARNATYEMREDLFARTLNLSGNQVDEFGLPSLTSRMTSDSYNCQSFMQFVQTMGVRSPIMLFGGIAITMTMDPALSSILAILAPISIVTVVAISFKGIPLYDKVQQSVDNIVRVMRENITGIRVVKALSKEEFEKRRYAQANSQMTHNEQVAGVVMSLPGPIMQLLLNAGLTLVVIVGALRVNSGQTQPGVILAFLTYFNMILMGIMGLNRLLLMMSKANASAKRIALVVEKEEDLLKVEESQAGKTESDDYIVFDRVDFRYGEHEKATHSNALTDISFSIPKGGSLGIIGATGCGKTTIINLLMRFYDTSEGHVFVDGKDVRSYERRELRRKFGVVFQNDVIFADTLKENISFGRVADEEKLTQAAKEACAIEFIEGYDDRFDHKAAIHGANMSGGQKQRVLISRALVGDPEILILDDASSALDYRTDAALRKAITEQHSQTTTIIVAQRISSIMNLDQIIMLDEGHIIGKGSHEEMMETCAPYREIFQTQMGEGR